MEAVIDALLPVLKEVGRGPPGEGASVLALRHGDAVCTHGDDDVTRLVVDGNDTKVGVELVVVFVQRFGADQLTVDDQTCKEIQLLIFEKQTWL